MGTITIFARMGLEPENVAQVKALATEACRVAADQPGTLVYDWHYSDEHRSLVVLETYANSAAALAHMQAAGSAGLESLMALIGSIEFFVLGEPTAEPAACMWARAAAEFAYVSRTTRLLCSSE